MKNTAVSQAFLSFKVFGREALPSGRLASFDPLKPSFQKH